MAFIHAQQRTADVVADSFSLSSRLYSPIATFMHCHNASRAALFFSAANARDEGSNETIRPAKPPFRRTVAN
jgi:hypothetical protein